MLMIQTYFQESHINTTTKQIKVKLVGDAVLKVNFLESNLKSTSQLMYECT